MGRAWFVDKAVEFALELERHCGKRRGHCRNSRYHAPTACGLRYNMDFEAMILRSIL